ncbi:family 16 glycosylhydrolase [Marinimicrobium koreense]|jgi:beta-glucanase (GH16 family)|uniref:Beta-glucanase (GH16 family) n=2 Tax=Marinimicrobium TaxID=359337 RepID=A0A3N1NWU4_9GAMM|nr:family 16 glycosylhydrolase [Marinimicrobium koreense]ROQ19457.1 beta-glucanase (GH16 family) [Marinimicrobium koreense]
MRYNHKTPVSDAQRRDNTPSVKRSLGLSAALAGILAFSAGTAQAQQCQNLVWSDEFDGSQLDTSAWDIQEGDGCQYGICGWGNNELQSYSANNLDVSNGTLKITARKERVKALNYTSGRIRTANMPASGQWTNGRFEARLKLPEGQGLWPAFWMLPTDPDVGWPMSGEIDILESTGQASMLAHGTIHYGEPWPDNSFTGAHILSQPAKWSDDFHTYAVEWTPFEMRWYVDDILYSTISSSDLEDSSWWTFENYQYHFLLNLAVGGTWGGTPDDSIFPVTMEVDYVRVYDQGQPAIDGPHIVAPNEQATYELTGEIGTDSTYTWSVPAGATLSGQGTATAQVDYTGATSGDLSVEVSNSCGTHTLNIPVFIEPDHGVETVLDDFDGNSALTYTSYTGTFDTTGGVLTYTRDGASQWDVIATTTNALPDVAPFLSGDKAFVMDINNTDPSLVGKQILVQLENTATATPDNYPTGRHSKYEAFVEHSNGAQTLRFRLADRIDGETTNTDVDSVIFLIDPDAFTSDTYVIDNIAILGAGGSTGGDGGSGDEQASSVVVSSVSTGTESAGRGQKFGTATVTIADDLGNPVSGATVTGDFSGTWSETQSATTDANGVASFITSTTASGGVTVNFCVSDITDTTLTFDSANSTGTCQ